MGTIWVTTLLLFLGINIAINMGAYEMMGYSTDTRYERAYNASEGLYEDVGSSSTGMEKGLMTYIIEQFLTPALIGAAVIGVSLLVFGSGAGVIAIYAGIFATMSSWFLNPISAVHALGLSPPLDVIVFLILNALLLVSLIDFVRGS